MIEPGKMNGHKTNITYQQILRHQSEPTTPRRSLHVKSVPATRRRGDDFYLATFKHNGRLNTAKNEIRRKKKRRKHRRRTKAQLDLGWRERAIWYSASERSYSDYTSTAIGEEKRQKYAPRQFRVWTVMYGDTGETVEHKTRGIEEISFSTRRRRGRKVGCRSCSHKNHKITGKNPCEGRGRRGNG